MRKLRLVLICALLVIPVAVAAQEDVTPHRVHVKITGTDYYPLTVAEIGCAWSDDPVPTGYESEPECYNCSQALCSFDPDDMHAAEGAYIVSTDYLSMTLTPSSVLVGQVYPGGEQQIFGMWYTDVAAEGNGWEDIYSMIVTVDGEGAVTPTPQPTLTPFPTPTPVPTPDISEGFSETFGDTYGTLSGSGALPSFGIDVETWLFYARKIIATINRGNLLYVVGGVLMAALVLGWAISQIKNPR